MGRGITAAVVAFILAAAAVLVLRAWGG